jgi:predicted O-methyltransferase YrrM
LRTVRGPAAQPPLRRDRPALDIPDLTVPTGIRRGREPREGYKRGWGLQFGDFAAMVDQEELFATSMTASAIRPLAMPMKLKNLYLVMTRYLPQLDSQNIIEFGAYQGGTALFMALVMREIAPAAKVYALDTFEGMPGVDASRDAHSRGDFADTSLDRLQAERDRLGLTNLVLVKGLFQDTFPTITDAFGLAHIDCDIYSGVKYAQEAVWPRMCRGGYVAYDDADFASCLGAMEAVEELIQTGKHSEQSWPHFVFRAGL